MIEFAFEKLQSFEFDNGALKSVIDHGDTARLVRQMLDSDGDRQTLDDKRLANRLPEAVRETLWWYKVQEERSKKRDRERIDGLDMQELNEGLERIKRIKRMRDKLRSEYGIQRDTHMAESEQNQKLEQTQEEQSSQK